MFDTMSKTTKLIIVSLIILLLSLTAAYKINYQKAVKVNKKIVSQYEKYLGDCTIDTICHEEIIEYMNDIGYIANNLKTKEEFICENEYCYKEIDNKTNETTYEIITQVNINIPIINKIIPHIEIFQILDETKPIVMDGDK